MIRVPFTDDWTVGPKLGAFEARTPRPRPGRSPSRTTRSAICRVLPGSDQGVHAAYHPGGVFEYAKTFDAPAEWREKTVIVEFEGVYRDAVVFVNGEFAAHQANGYAVVRRLPRPVPALRRSQPHHGRGARAQGQPVVYRRRYLPTRAPARRRPDPYRTRRHAGHDARDRRRPGRDRGRHAPSRIRRATPRPGGSRGRSRAPAAPRSQRRRRRHRAAGRLVDGAGAPPRREPQLWHPTRPRSTP